MRLHSILISLLTASILVLAGCGGATTATTDGSGAGMNLRITSASITSSPGAPVKGGTVQITVLVANNGTMATPDTTYSYTLGTDSTITASLPAVAAGATVPITFGVTSTTAGSKTVTVELDKSNVVNERSESDNSATVNITWTESSLRNIAITGAAVADNALQVGDTASLSFNLSYSDVDYPGTTTLKTVKWRIVRADDTSVVLKTDLTSNFFNTSVGVATTFTDPTAVGAQEYLLQADYLHEVSESLETDNEFPFTITWSASG